MGASPEQAPRAAFTPRIDAPPRACFSANSAVASMAPGAKVRVIPQPSKSRSYWRRMDPRNWLKFGPDSPWRNTTKWAIFPERCGASDPRGVHAAHRAGAGGSLPPAGVRGSAPAKRPPPRPARPAEDSKTPLRGAAPRPARERPVPLTRGYAAARRAASGETSIIKPLEHYESRLIGQ
jgi:hypothetical protein